MSQQSTHAACRACDDTVPTRSTTCPACGYDVRRHDRARLALGLVGTALTVSVVMAPVGVPLLWAAFRSRLHAEGTVSEPAADTLAEVSATVLSQHFGGRQGIDGEPAVPGRHSVERNA